MRKWQCTVNGVTHPRPIATSVIRLFLAQHIVPRKTCLNFFNHQTIDLDICHRKWCVVLFPFFIDPLRKILQHYPAGFFGMDYSKLKLFLI